MQRVFVLVVGFVFCAFIAAKGVLSCITNFKGNTSYSLYRTDHNGAYSKPFRIVKTTNGDEKITVVDSYNLFYQNSFKLNTAKVKIEKSSEEGYPVDKEIVLDNLNFMIANTKHVSSNKVEEIKYGNSTFYGMTKNDINVGTFAGNYVLFPGENLVCYINFLNVKKDSSDTKTIEEFIVKRNQFFQDLDASLKKCK
jgi:hypothetical protein